MTQITKVLEDGQGDVLKNVVGVPPTRRGATCDLAAREKGC